MQSNGFDLKYFISPQVLPLPVGLMMIVCGLAGGLRSTWLTFELSPLNGVVMAAIGVILTFYSLWLSRKFMSVESAYVEELIEAEKCDALSISLLKKRNALSDNMDKIMSILEEHPNGISRPDLELKYTGDTGRELSLRLKNLMLEGFITMGKVGGTYFYYLSKEYRALLEPIDQTVIGDLE